MVKRKHASICMSNMLVLGSLLGLTVTLSGCSKNDDTSNCRDLFTSSYLLSLQRQPGSAGVAAAQLQNNATADDITSAKVASLNSSDGTVTTQALDSDRDELIYRVLDRLPGGVTIEPDGSFIYTPTAEQRRAAAEEFRDRFEVEVRDDHPHLHGLPGLLRDRFPITVPIRLEDLN